MDNGGGAKGATNERPICITMGISFIAISSESNQIGKNTEGYDDEEHRVLSTGR